MYLVFPINYYAKKSHHIGNLLINKKGKRNHKLENTEIPHPNEASQIFMAAVKIVNISIYMFI